MATIDQPNKIVVNFLDVTLNELGPYPDIEWPKLQDAPAYSLGNRTCDLCLTEKVEIAKNYKDPGYLNRRGELAHRCRHRTRHLLFVQEKFGTYWADP